jgi:hypothetical protein
MAVAAGATAQAKADMSTNSLGPPTTTGRDT